MAAIIIAEDAPPVPTAAQAITEAATTAVLATAMIFTSATPSAMTATVLRHAMTMATVMVRVNLRKCIIAGIKTVVSTHHPIMSLRIAFMITATMKQIHVLTVATTAAVITAMTIPQNAQAAYSNALAMNPITATAMVRGSMIHAVKTGAIHQLENAKRIPATMIQTQATAVTTVTATTEILLILILIHAQLLKERRGLLFQATR